MADEDDWEELPGESEVMDFWLRAVGDFKKVVEGMGLSDDDLKKILERYNDLDGTISCGMSALIREVQIHRRIRLIVNEVRPGEDLVPLIELAERRRTRESAGEN